MWGRVSGEAAAPPLLSCRFHEVATKTGFNQTAGEEPRRGDRDREKQEIRATPEKFCTNHSVHQRAVYTHRSDSRPGAAGPL